MYRNSSTRIFPLIIIIVVVIALIAGLVTIARSVFFSGGESKSAQESAQEQSRERLLTVSDSRSARMTIRGPIVGDPEFRSYQVVVSPQSREYIVYKGYLDEVVEKKSFDNNTAAYEEFVYALDKAALTRPGKETKSQADDLRGICATGNIHQYELLDDGAVTDGWWTSDCKGSPGTFGASVSQVTSLFSRQLPGVDLDYESNGIRGLRL